MSEDEKKKNEDKEYELIASGTFGARVEEYTSGGTYSTFCLHSYIPKMPPEELEKQKDAWVEKHGYRPNVEADNGCKGKHHQPNNFCAMM